MRKLFPHTDEFYVGYLSSSPVTIGSFFKKALFFGIIITAAIATVLGTSQRDFTTSEFEYGTYTSLSGVLLKFPVPHLRISLGKNRNGEELFQSVVLVGAGKNGLNNQLQKFVSKTSVTIKGFLIYGDGKALLQINDVSDVQPSGENITGLEPQDEIAPRRSKMIVTGEITDPKCYFGVMKPGEGKPHRSCAIRCIAGGIPAVLKTNSSDYFLLLNENMQSLNSEVLNIVGDQVSLEGEMVQLDDWKILKVNAKKVGILARSVEQKNKLLAMEAEMTLCSH